MPESFETALPVPRGSTPPAARTPPHSIQAEEALLCCCLLDSGDTLSRLIMERFNPYAFYAPANRLIYDTLRDMHADQKEIDVAVLAEELRTARQLDSIGGFRFLTELTGRVPTTVQSQYFADKLREMHRLRELITRGTDLVESCYAYQGDMPGEIVPKVERLNSVLQDHEAARSWPQAVAEAEEITRERMKPEKERKMGNRELSWGMADMDRFFGPLEPGELVVIGGYTSSGKSSLLRGVLWSIARRGFGSLLETIEVRDAEEAINLAAHISGLRSRSKLDQLHPKDQAELLATFETMRNAPFAVNHVDHSMEAMFARVRAFKQKRGLVAWGADYLQIMEDVKNLRHGEREDQAIGRVTSGMKQFSTREGLITFLLSGFNREYIRSESGRDPKMSDLSGSSSIEKDASRVLLLHIPTEFSINGQKFTQSLTPDADVRRFFVKLIQAKGRNQGTASIGLWFNRETKTFVQIESAQRAQGTAAFRVMDGEKK